MISVNTNDVQQSKITFDHICVASRIMPKVLLMAGACVASRTMPKVSWMAGACVASRIMPKVLLMAGGPVLSYQQQYYNYMKPAF